MRTKWSIQELIYTSILVVVAGVLMSLGFSVLMMPPFCKIDFSDASSIIVLFLLGPVSATWVEIIKIIIKLITVGTNFVYVGEFANLIGVVLFVVPMWAVYKKDGKTRRAAIASLAVSVPIGTLFACFYNASITPPLYAATMGPPLNQVITMMTAINPAISDLTTFISMATIPFNLIKLGLNCFVGYPLYTRLLAIHPAVGTA